MGIIDKLTKSLFGLRKKGGSESNGDIEIRDGQIIAIDTPESKKCTEYNPTPVFKEKGPSEGLKSQKTRTQEIQGSKPPKDPLLENEKRPKNAFVLAPDEHGFMEWMTLGNRAERTKQEYIWELRWWKRKAKRRKKELHELTVNDIESALRRVKAQAALRKIAALKTWARWQLREGRGNLFLEVEKVIKPKRSKSLPKDLGHKRFMELKSLAMELISQGKREGIWIGLMLCGGLRISEIKTCQPYQNGVKVVGKGNKERYVPLPEWLLKGMTDIRKRPPGGWAVTRKTISKELSQKYDLRRLHSLRHTYASELVRRGFKIEEIKILLGHENIQTTTIYARIDVPDDVVRRLGL